MMAVIPSNVAALARRVRSVTEGVDGATRVQALWRCALLASIQEYGPGLTACALRDLADEIERDLIATGRLQ